MVFGLGKISINSSLASSTIVVYSNVVKQVLFKLGALLLQFFIFKLFSLLASSRRAFTSYLMFAEDYIQKTLYIVSRGFSSGGLFVLLLTILLLVGTWFDAVLWALDSPGYISQKSNVTADKIEDGLLPEPGYLVFSLSAPGDVASLDERLVDMMGSNLFQPGVNFSLTGEIDRGTPKTVAPSMPFDEAGPRIWLDHDGFSITADTYITYGRSINNSSDIWNCPWQTTGANSKAWNCTYDNAFAYNLAHEIVLGQPEIHWDVATSRRFESQYVTTSRGDNPWHSLGKGGATALMKQMFTVTKDRMRHTFIETFFKTCMVADWENPLRLEEVTDLIKRAWSTDPADQTDPYIYELAKSIIEARNRNSSGSYGFVVETGTSVAQVNYELLNMESMPGVVLFSLFRASVVNITLVRSDELSHPAIPFEPCDVFYANIARGGKVVESDCYLRAMTDDSQEGHRFWGEMDTSAFLVLGGVLGKGSTNHSKEALNQEAWEWVNENDERLSNLVLSRGAILSLGSSTAMVEISSVQPAISALQILLIVICAVLAAVSWLSLILLAKAHYSSSLLANLVATTMLTSDGDDIKSGKPKYLTACPEISLIHENGTRTVMATQTGKFEHVEFEGAGVRERLFSGEGTMGSGDEHRLAKSTTVSQFEVTDQQSDERC